MFVSVSGLSLRENLTQPSGVSDVGDWFVDFDSVNRQSGVTFATSRNVTTALQFRLDFGGSAARSLHDRPAVIWRRLGETCRVERETLVGVR